MDKIKDLEEFLQCRGWQICREWFQTLLEDRFIHLQQLDPTDKATDFARYQGEIRLIRQLMDNETLGGVLEAHIKETHARERRRTNV